MNNTSMILLCALALPLFAQKQNPPGDTFIFQGGLALSWNNDHDGAVREFKRYQANHPDDPLPDLRIMYTQFFKTGHGKNLSREAYAAFLADLRAAVRKYETKDCHTIDFNGIARSLDCAYVGAALWSLQMVLRGENEGWRKVGEEHKRFLAYIDQSKSPQKNLLYGVYAYKTSTIPWGYKAALKLCPWFKVPTDRDEAIRTIMRALEKNDSYFFDDILFALLDIERGNKEKVKDPCDPNRKPDSPAMRELLEKYPPRSFLSSLQPRYPSNSQVREFAAACGSAEYPVSK